MDLSMSDSVDPSGAGDPFSGLGGPIPSRNVPPGRGAWRVAAAGAVVVLGGAIVAAGIIATMMRWVPEPGFQVSLVVGVAVCAVGFAVYDSRWPFGRRRNSPGDWPGLE